MKTLSDLKRNASKYEWKLVKFGAPCTNSNTGETGVVTHLVLRPGENGVVHKSYVFQPGRLNSKTGRPAKTTLVDAPGIKGEETEIAEPPVELMGETLKDKCTGFAGKVTDIVVFMTGCCHATLQPAGTNEEGETAHTDNFDLTRLEGEAMDKYRTREAEENATAETKGAAVPKKNGGPFDPPAYHQHQF